MDSVWKNVWAVEWQNEGRTERFFDYKRHETPEEAMQAFAEEHNLTWEEAEQKGAKVVVQEILAST